MKVSEFEARLSEVEDARLLLMLATSRREGPEIAVKMILAEAEKRGLPNLDPVADSVSESVVEPIVESVDDSVVESADEEMPASPVMDEKVETFETVEKVADKIAENISGQDEKSEIEPSPLHLKEDSAIEEPTNEDSANLLEDAPTRGSKWLEEESSTSKGYMFKIIGALVVLGIVIFGIFKATQH